MTDQPTICSHGDCTKAAQLKGLCRQHYATEWYRTNKEALKAKRSSPTGIACPACQHTQSEVTNSRGCADHSYIHRRRRCVKCKHSFSTHEQAVGGTRERDWRYEYERLHSAIEVIMEPA